jgi:hypothetical protein
MITPEEVREHFDYCLSDGYLYRKTGRFKGQKAGTIKAPHGYITVSFKNVKYYAHRLIWMWLTGYNPVGCIDHRDRNPSNNLWFNLRDVSLTANQYNRGEVGASKMSNGKHRAYITVGRTFIHLGCFGSRQEAIDTRNLYYETEIKRP